MRNVLFFATLLAAPTAFAAEGTDHFDVVNASDDTITAVALARAGSGMFRTVVDEHNHPVPVERGETLAIATRLREGGCLRDVRVKFGNGKVLLQGIDVCKNQPFRAAPPA